MSVLLPRDHDWLTGQWVAMRFFGDALKVAPSDSEFRPNISRFLATEFRTLDLSNQPVSSIRRFAELVDAVIAHNERLHGSDFHQPEFFPVYAAQLQELRKVVQDALAGMEATPSNRIGG